MTKAYQNAMIIYIIETCLFNGSSRRIKIKCLRYFLILSLINLPGCYYYPDLRFESAGSFIGGVGAGLLVAEAGGDLISMGAGSLLGSVLGGITGTNIDNCSPLMRQDPVNDPVNLFYYQVLRPNLVRERFYPGQIYIGDAKSV